MTDFVNLLIEMRDGQVAADINEKFNEVLMAVLNTARKGELTIKFKIKPSKMGMGGSVIEVETTHEAKTTRPELNIGQSVFFVDQAGTPSCARRNPYARRSQRPGRRSPTGCGSTLSTARPGPDMLSRLLSLYCRLVHPAPMWPVNGRYTCRTCFRSYPVPWQESPVGKPGPLVREGERTLSGIERAEIEELHRMYGGER